MPLSRHNHSTVIEWSQPSVRAAPWTTVPTKTMRSAAFAPEHSAGRPTRSSALRRATRRWPAYTAIETAKLYDVDPQAWLADSLARLPDQEITRIDGLLPWR